MTIALNVKHFGDFRSFLRSYLELKQKTNPNFSLGLWAKKLGFSSTSTLTKILSGDRNPGDDVIQKFAVYFNFSDLEFDYFTDLVRLSRIKDDIRLKVLLMEKMGREHKDASLTLIDERNNEVVANWFHLCIREMTNLSTFVPEAAWIKQRLLFPVSEEEINRSLDLLTSLGLVVKNENGNLEPNTGLVHTTNDVPCEVIKSYHNQTLQLAQDALYRIPVAEREFSSETLTVSKERLPEAKELIRSFKAQFLRLLEERGGDETYQLQIQFYPLTGSQNL